MTGPTPAHPVTPAGQMRRWPALAAIGAFAFCLYAYAWVGPLAVDRISAPAPQGYYALLTEALLSGQLHLKLQPDPALKHLANPWAGNQGVQRLHDATYFNDRYYLYFSAVPAVLVGAPWRLLTGEYLTDGGTTYVLITLGFVAGAALLLRFRKLWFDRLPPGWLALGLLLYGLGNTMLWLGATHSVYPVPTSAAVTLALLALLALVRALHHPRWRSRVFALGLASLGWGLAVGSRPHYLPTLGALGIAVAYLAWCAGRERGWLARTVPAVLAAGILPAALVGTTLAAYNFARFGSFTEFGTTYMFAAGDQRTMAMFDLANFPLNFRAYVLEPAIYGPYFPYLTPREAGVGVLPGMPLALLGLLWPVTLLHAPLRRSPSWIIVNVSLLTLFSVVLFMDCLLPTTHVRYRSDWMPYGLLAGMLTFCGLTAWIRQWVASRRIGGFIRLLLLAIVGWTAVHAVLLAFVNSPQPEKARGIAQAFNQVTAGIQRLQGIEFGAVSGQISFPPGVPGQREALVVSGSGQDLLYVDYLENQAIRIGFHHVGDGGPISEPFAIEPGREYDLDLNLGCFYPPAEHPVFADWSESQVRRLRRQLVVSLDGKELLRGGSEFYPTHPADIHFAANPGPYPPHRGFTGRLANLRHLGVPTLATTSGPSQRGPLRLTVRFPAFQNFRSEPLISTGHKAEGDLLYVTYLAPDQLRFGHDVWGGGAVETGAVTYSPDTPQVIEVEMPAFAGTGVPSGRLIVRYNGTTLMADDRPVHPASAAEVFLGFNGSDSSAARMNFTGRFERVESIPALALPTDQFQTTSGAARFVLKFPTGLVGRKEPLLCTGRAGAADVVYVHYEDESHLRIGYDHWSKGGPVSPPIPVDYAATHEIVISLSSLLPDGDDPAWGRVDAATRQARENVVVQLNGQEVFRHREEAYPTAPGDIHAGLNPVGASTCERLFSGRIFVKERLGLPVNPE